MVYEDSFLSLNTFHYRNFLFNWIFNKFFNIFSTHSRACNWKTFLIFNLSFTLIKFLHFINIMMSSIMCMLTLENFFIWSVNYSCLGKSFDQALDIFYFNVTLNVLFCVLFGVMWKIKKKISKRESKIHHFCA